MTGQILIVDDEPEIRSILGNILKAEGFDVIVAASGAALRMAIKQVSVDLVILDLMLPDEDGLNLTDIIRDQTDAGIIMLTGKSAKRDVIAGLKAGADDYVAKPFDDAELLARIHSVLRRTKKSPQKQLGLGSVKFRGWRFDSAYQRLTNPGGDITMLTGTESRLLQFLIDNPGKSLSRQRLQREVLRSSTNTDSRGIDVLMVRLRKKFEAGVGGRDIIKTVRGVGYQFCGGTEIE